MLIFGYDNFLPDGKPITNGYAADLKNNISPISLEWAGYESLIDTTDKEIYKRKGKLIFPTHFEWLVNYFNIQIEKVKNINEKYYYPIDVFPLEFWKNPKSHNITISSKAIDDIKNGMAKILLLFVREGLRPFDDINSIIRSWMKKYKLPDNSVVVSTANLWQKLDDNITSVPFSVWEHIMRRFYINDICKKNIEGYIKTAPKRDKLFLCYNRRPRHHRIQMVYELYNQKLLDYGLVSLREDIPKNYILPEDFLKLLPLTIDNRNLHMNYATDVTLDDYKNTYVSIITETLSYNNMFFPSEKMCKPLITMHPFFMLSSKHFLKGMRSLGYKTFSKWWDESYDNHDILDDRISGISEQIKMLHKLTDKQLSNMVIDMLPVLKHNQNVFFKRSTIKDYQYELERILI